MSPNARKRVRSAAAEIPEFVGAEIHRQRAERGIVLLLGVSGAGHGVALGCRVVVIVRRCQVELLAGLAPKPNERRTRADVDGVGMFDAVSRVVTFGKLVDKKIAIAFRAILVTLYRLAATAFRQHNLAHCSSQNRACPAV